MALSGDGARLVAGSISGWLSESKEWPVCVYDLLNESEGGLRKWEPTGDCIEAPRVTDDCSVVSVDGTGSVVGVACEHMGELVDRAGGVRVYHQMGECAAEKNVKRLETNGNLVVGYHGQDEKLDRNKQKEVDRKRAKFEKQRNDCEDKECEDEVDKKEKRAKKKTNKKFKAKKEKNVEDFSKGKVKSGKQFMRKVRKCEVA